MTDRKLLPLADGSQWSSDDISDSRGNEFGLWKTDGGDIRLSGDGPAVDIPCSADHRDLIALLHRAGLLDELLAEAWEEGESAGFNAGKGQMSERNPYRKAGE